MNHSGFTLIELLIVIAIIGILAVILLPNMLGAQKRVYDMVALSCASTLVKAVAIYRVDNNILDKSSPVLTSIINVDAAADKLDPTNDTYMTERCTKTRGILLEDKTTNAKLGYQYWVKHKNGSNTYEVSDAGVKKAGLTN